VGKVSDVFTNARITTGSCGRRGQRTMFPDTFVAVAAHPERWATYHGGSDA